MTAIDGLVSRVSITALAEPAPDGEHLDMILAAAQRAPDHGRLRPWRFILIRGTARKRFGDVLAAAVLRREPTAPSALLDKERAKPLRAPLIIAVAARVIDSPKVPAIEQIIAAGCAAHAALLAADALGYGGVWRTGDPAYDDGVKAALGLASGDALVGFLYLGTPLERPPIIAGTKPEAVIRDWTGE